MNGKTVGIIALVIVVLGGVAWYVYGGAASPAPQGQQVPTGSGSTTTTSTTTTTTTSTNPQSQNVTITYTNQGFSPSSVTIPEGATVTFVNQSSENMWVASDPHPTHQGYDGTTRAQHCAAGYTGAAPFDECAAAPAGASFTFTFTKAGSWGYHNHAVDEDHGTIVVTAPGGTNASGSVNVQL